MYLRPPHDDAVLLPVDDPQVIILVLLLFRGMQAPVALDVRDGAGNAEVLLLEQLPVSFHPLGVVRLDLLVHDIGRDGKGGEGVGAHAVEDDPSAAPHADDKTFPPTEQVLGRPRGGQEEIDLLPFLVARHKEIAVIGMVRQDIVHRRPLNDAAQGRMGAHVSDLFAQAPDLPSVIEAIEILFDCSNHRSISPLLPHLFS
ncbi:MAG: hypothetical protein MUP30_08890 [Deltaproteobacteria bacterium]|nr:hypothetical protein [Deltaproteobacteria bacterium]